MSTPLTVYVAMINDRHSDPEPYLFSTAAEAIDYARRCAQEYAYEPASIDETPVDGWLYHARYSEESDVVWVLAKAVDNPGSKP